MLLSVSAYFLGIWLYPSFLTKKFSKFYTWVEGTLVDRGTQFTALLPTVDLVGLTLIVALPLLIIWLGICAIPRSIRWVRDGYHHEPKSDT